MKVMVKGILVFIGIAVTAALLTPILFDFLPFKFEKIFNRIVMIGVLAGAVFFVRISRETLSKYGLRRPESGNIRALLLGFVTAVGMLGLLIGIKMALNLAQWAPMDIPASRIIYKFAVIFATAVLIGVLEEFFFRGFVFQSLMKKFRAQTILCVILTSVFYALVHFVSYRKVFIDADPGWLDGFKLFLNPVVSLQAFPFYWHEAVGLFLLGVVLNILVIKTKSLYPAMGFHAGCVFFVKLDGTFFHYIQEKVYLFASDKLYDGLVGWVILLAMGAIFLRCSKYLKQGVT